MYEVSVSEILKRLTVNATEPADHLPLLRRLWSDAVQSPHFPDVIQESGGSTVLGQWLVAAVDHSLVGESRLLITGFGKRSSEIVR